MGRNEVWRYGFDSQTWEEVETNGGTPEGRWSTGIVWDADGRRMIAFGGTDGVAWFDDLWLLEAAD